MGLMKSYDFFDVKIIKDIDGKERIVNGRKSN